MQWYTLGQLLAVMRPGQKASTPDGRTVVRTDRGLEWSGGRENGRLVELRDPLFSDLWTFSGEEDSRSRTSRDSRAAWAREREMIVNQYEEWLADYREQKRREASEEP
ncbi:hypothetical protein F4V43_10215 [Paenibacillus spiritus]|uniref:Uncharacterized protein n=1 Tax=Paenibacillus spiritus TaxID=2496557 RepID=A0A5J5G924_9BACL|nr:hypothetical protein [Paenibacillus spiritus]KAA9004689.1 hypothetical protein F4V43_10215 [Paenibacillus spiritus]